MRNILARIAMAALLLSGCQDGWPTPADNDASTSSSSAAGGTYVAEGRLGISEVLSVHPDTQGYTLRDPDTGAIRAYVTAEPGGPVLHPYVGRLVRIVGTVEQDRHLGLIITARSVTPQIDDPEVTP